MIRNAARIVIGKNNYIEDGVTICKGVVIGDNNKIYSGTTIYPNTVIGNENVFLNGNIIGEHPVDANESFTQKEYGGVIIGNYNYFHVNNLVSSGRHGKTIIGNSNKFLSEVAIHHDTVIENNVVFYPRSISAGLCRFMSHSSIGMGTAIQQRSVIGNYSMIGMGSVATHSVFPFFIYYDNSYIRLNSKRLPKDIVDFLDFNNLKDFIQDVRADSLKALNALKSYNFNDRVEIIILEFMNSIGVNNSTRI